jgi:hypothetical protein
MEKFDTSCGLAKDQIRAIKYSVKKEIAIQLPVLPEPVEMKLFFEGRDSWIYRWGLIETKGEATIDKISLEVTVKLKKGFHDFLECKAYKFLCSLKLQKHIYHPKINLKREKLGV